MKNDFGKKGFDEKRSEPRKIIDKYFRVEFSKDGLIHFYNFKLRDISSKGMCILVKEGSEVMKFFKVGDVLDMKYYTGKQSNKPQQFKTKIIHITKDDQGKFKGHCLVGFSIIE